MRMILSSKIKVVTTMLLVAGAFAAGGTGLAYRAQATEPDQKDGPQRQIDDKKEPRTTKVHGNPLRMLEGDWKLVAIRRFGREVRYNLDSDAVGNNAKIEGGAVTLPIYLDVKHAGVAYVKFKLRDGSNEAPPHSERWIDLVNEDLETVARMMRGIYKTEGKILMICLDPTGGNSRPRTFGTWPGSDQQLIILRRR
jgi:uncharacterized protein (TIGR03067 family)